MGENTLALLSYMTSTTADLSDMSHSISTVFFSALGGRIFFIYSKAAALRIYVSMTVILLAVVVRAVSRERIRVYVLSAIAAPLSLLCGLVSSNAIGFILDGLCGKPMSWYRR